MMMKDNLTKALIYESQGLLSDAGKIYKDILDIYPDDEKAKLGLIRVKKNLENPMLALFLSTDEEDINKFKRWLVDI